MAGKRPRVEHTEDFQELLPLCLWPEQVEYERIRQPVLFGDPVAARAEQTGVSESTLRRRIGRFEAEGMEGLFAAQTARRWKLPPNIRRLIVDLKAEYPPFNLNEIANVVRACFGRKPDARSVERVLDAEVRPLKLQRNYPRYHEMGPGEGRAAVVELRVDGWSAKAIAGSQMGPLVGAYRAGLAAYRIGLAVLDRFAWTRYGAPFAEPANDGNRDEPGWRLLRHTGVWFQTPAEENRTEEPVIGGQDPGSSRRWPLSPRTGRRAPRGAPARRGGAAMT